MVNWKALNLLVIMSFLNIIKTQLKYPWRIPVIQNPSFSPPASSFDLERNSPLSPEITSPGPGNSTTLTPPPPSSNPEISHSLPPPEDLILLVQNVTIPEPNISFAPSPSSSTDLESSSENTISLPSSSPNPQDLQTETIPEKHTNIPPSPLPSSPDLPQTQTDFILPHLLQANLSSPVTTIVPPPQSLNTAAETQGIPPEHGFMADAPTMLQYLLFVAGVCYAAVSATLQALQGTRPLSTASKIVYAALLVSFTVFVVSVYIRTNYPRAFTIAVHVGSLFGFTAFLVALFSSLTRRH